VLTPPGAPEDVDLRLNADLKNHLLTVTATDQVGNYAIRAHAGSAELAHGFSVNLAREETRLERVSDEDLAALFDPVPCQLARDRGQLEAGRSRQRVGRELFASLILLVALALGIEHVLANRFYRE
jgi:hypothetical protein